MTLITQTSILTPFTYPLEAIDVAHMVMRLIACFAVTTVLLVCFVILVLSVAFTLNVLEHAFSVAIAAPTLSIPVPRAPANPSSCQRDRAAGRSRAGNDRGREGEREAEEGDGEEGGTEWV